MKLIVIGGTGYLGTRLVARLRQDPANDIRILSRSQGQDIREPGTFASYLSGADVVYHLAALVQSRPGDFRDINVRGLGNVLQACATHEVQKLVYVSSFTVFGPSLTRPHREGPIAQRQDFFHGYDRTKYDALRMIERWKSRLPINTVFPTVVFGPGPLTEGNIMAQLFRRWLTLKTAPLPNYGKPVWNFAFVEDVAKGLDAIRHLPPDEDFILGGENCSLRDLASKFSKVSHKKIQIVGMPPLVFKMSSYLEDWGSRLFGFSPLVLPSTAGFFLNDWEFSIQRARKFLGYSPRPLDSALAETYQWMQAAKKG